VGVRPRYREPPSSAIQGGIVRMEDGADPAGRARIRAHSRSQVAATAPFPDLANRFPTSFFEGRCRIGDLRSIALLPG